MAYSHGYVRTDPTPIHWIRNRCRRQRQEKHEKTKKKMSNVAVKRELILSTIATTSSNNNNNNEDNDNTHHNYSPSLSMLRGLEDSILPLIFSFVGPEELLKPCTCCQQIEGNYVVFCCEQYIPFAVDPPEFEFLEEDDPNGHVDVDGNNTNMLKDDYDRLVRYYDSRYETPLPKEAFDSDDGNKLQYFSYCMKMAHYSSSVEIYDDESQIRVRKVGKLPGSFSVVEGTGSFGWTFGWTSSNNFNDKIWTPITTKMMTMEDFIVEGFIMFGIDGVEKHITIDDFSASSQTPWEEEEKKTCNSNRQTSIWQFTPPGTFDYYCGGDGDGTGGGSNTNNLLVVTKEKSYEYSRWKDENGPIPGFVRELETYVFDFGVRHDIVDRIVSRYRSYMPPDCWRAYHSPVHTWTD